MTSVKLVADTLLQQLAPSLTLTLTLTLDRNPIPNPTNTTNPDSTL